MIQTPTMQLPKPEAGDPMEPFFLGTQPDGGYWTTMTRLSEHDHTGGLNGKTLTAATIPDGSITPSKLAPSVYAPLAFADGSKPFTGTQEFQADAVVRDALLFGQQGGVTAPDVQVLRTAAGALALQTAPAGGTPFTTRLTVAQNGTTIITPAGGASSLVASAQAGNESSIALRSDDNQWDMLKFNRTDDVARWLFGANPTFKNLSAARYNDVGAFINFPFEISRSTGTVTLTPDAGQAAISAGANHLALSVPAGYAVMPILDNTGWLGNSANRWSGLYAVNGTIQTSAAEAKTDITPLDPAAALAAVLATDPVVFDYKPPERDATSYELPDDPEQAERVLYDRMVAEPLMEAARHQAGFVLQDASGQYQTDPLFETGEGQSNAANSVGVILAALHAIDARLTAGGL